MSLCSAIEALLSKRLPLRGKQKAVPPSDRRGFRDWRGFLILLAVVLLSGRVRAEETCGDFPGAAPPVAHLVSSVGEVTVGGRPPSGEAPDQPICAGDLVEVGAASRALVHLVGADTPLRLDENTVSRFYSAARAGQRPGRSPARRALLPERGAADAHRAHALRQCRRRGDRGLSARRRCRDRDDRARGPGRGHAGQCQRRCRSRRPRWPRASGWRRRRARCRR